MDISLNINGTPAEFTGLDTSAKKDVLGLKNGDKVSGTLVITLADGSTRNATLSPTTIGIETKLSFSVTYKYILCDSEGNSANVEGTYTTASGIDVSGITWTDSAAGSGNTVSGWRTESGVTYAAGGRIYGLTGDARLTSVYNTSGTPVLSATADTDVLYASATSSESTTITITNVTGTAMVSSISSQLTNDPPVQDSFDPSKYTVDIHIVGGSNPVWFGDDTAANVNITDDSGVITSVPLTLKNKYSYVLLNHTGEGGTITHGPENAGYELTFADATSIVSAYSTPVPPGRSIVAFNRTSPTPATIYNGTDFPITFNSTNFSSRSITLQSVLDLVLDTKDAGNPSQTWTGTPYTNSNGEAGLLYVLEKYSQTNKELHVAVTGCSANSNLSVIPDNQDKLEIAQTGLTTSGTFIIKLTDNVTNGNIPSNGYIYKITVKDNGTGAEKIFFVKVAQPPEYKYSLKYQKADGTFAPIGTTNQDQEFTSGSQIYFGGQTAPLTMGKLDSSLTGVEAAIQINGWTATGPNANSLSYGPFPNPGPADCTSNGSGGYSIELIATTNPDLGTFYNNCRANSNAVQNGDVVLSTGLCVNNTYYANNRAFLDPYVVGTVCIRGGNQKFVVAKSSSNNTNLTWSNVTVNIGGLQVAVTGTDLQIGILPTYDLNEAGLSFSSDSSGKDSLSTLLSAGQNVDDYPAFKYCKDYKPTGVTTGSYSSDWYLPSLAEAYAIHQQLNTFPSGFVDTQLWLTTSNQNNQYYFWYTQGSSITPGLGNITTISKGYTSTDFQVYPCHEFNFTAPPQ